VVVRAAEGIHDRVLRIVTHAHRAGDVLVVGVLPVGREPQICATHQLRDTRVFPLRGVHCLMQVVVELVVHLGLGQAQRILLGA
jgi:hypothetical protein